MPPVKSKLTIKRADESVQRQVARGETFSCTYEISNEGVSKDNFTIWIDSTDNSSEPILRWYDFNESNPFTVDKFKKITLLIEVPPQAIPGLYNYEILLQLAGRNAGKTISIPEQLKVTQSDNDAELGSEPGFFVEPITTSTKPYKFKQGEELEVKIKVENRSQNTDTFYLYCDSTSAELKNNWFTVKYPTSTLDSIGLVKETDGLQLNPKKSGEIILKLHPPRETLAGNYFPTIRLGSKSKQDLLLLDVFYLQILPEDNLDIKMYPLLRKIPKEGGEFQLQLTNNGNTKQEITVHAQDKNDIFQYQIFYPKRNGVANTNNIILSPGEKFQEVTLKALPKKGWLRPIIPGKVLEFPFNIELKNNSSVATSYDAAKLPQNLPQGNLIWESRPLWQFLLGLGILGLIGFIIWGYFLKNKIPPLLPKIEKFSVVTPEKYQEGQKDNILLDWEITQIEKIDKIEKVTVTRLEGNVETDRKNYLSEKLLTLCSNQKAKKSENQNLDSFNNQESNPGFSLFNPFKINLFGLFGDKEPQKEKSLVCQKINLGKVKAGKYTFKIEVFPKDSPEVASSSRITDTIEVKPAVVVFQPVPQILDFSSTKPSYEELDEESRIKFIDTFKQPLVNKLSINGLPSAPITLNWKISNPKNIKELKIIGLAPDGSVSSELKNYKVDPKKRLPIGLEAACKLKEVVAEPSQNRNKPKEESPEKGEKLEELECNNISTGALKAGDYVFKLTIIPLGGKEENAIVKQTPTIKLQSLPLPEIRNFSPAQHKYQEVRTSPQTAAGRRNTSGIKLNWNISNPYQIRQIQIVGLGADGSISGKPETYQFFGNKIPAQLNSFCAMSVRSLNCNYVPTSIAQAGNYTFKITVIPKDTKAKTEIFKTTDGSVKIQALPLPQISNLLPSQPVYKVGGTNPPPIGLNLNVANPNQIKEVKIVSLAADGSVSGKPRNYSIGQLRSLCQVTPANLNCKNLLTDITQPGNYSFRVSVIPTQGEPGTEITKTSDAIKIEAPPPVPPTPVKIISFKINDEEVINKPKRTFPINKLRSNPSVSISWQVQAGKDIKVELSPSPGVVGASGSQILPLSQPPSNETITLKVTNKAGEQTTQSVQIQTVEPLLRNQPASRSGSSGRSSGGSASGSGTSTPGNNASPANSSTPSNPSRLSPMELPPKAD
jgi:hypothetical protein